MLSTRLLIIDPQNDFCDFAAPAGAAEAWPAPALPVPGADADLCRLAALIDRVGEHLQGIDVSLDSHHPIDIAHPAWWVDEQGAPPAPFTVISLDDGRQGRWRARHPAAQARSLRYLEQLEQRGRYQLMVWPEHCLIGHWGHNIHPVLAQALDRWSRSCGRPVDYVIKGTNPATEHYSALQAEVPDPDDPSSCGNPELLARLRGASQVLVAGEALSHCVAATVLDLAQALGDGWLANLAMLRDASSPVAGFEAQGRDFLREIESRGARVVSCAQIAESMGPGPSDPVHS